VNLLITKELHLLRMDKLADKYEGRRGRNYEQEVRQEIEQNLAAGGSYFGRRGMTKEEFVNEWAAQAAHYESLIPQISFASCWAMENDESEAMWRIYGAGPAAASLVVSYAKLRDSISLDRDLYMGVVKYFDFEAVADKRPLEKWPLMNKRKQFKYENEVRLVKVGRPPIGQSQVRSQGRRPILPSAQAGDPLAADSVAWETVAREGDGMHKIMPLGLALVCCAAHASDADSFSASEVASCSQPYRTAVLNDGHMALQATSDSQACYGAFLAIQQISATSLGNAHVSVLKTCLPEKADLLELTTVFLHYADKHPERGHEKFTKVVLSSFWAAYSCRPSAKAK